MKLINPKLLLIIFCTCLLVSWVPEGVQEVKHVDVVFCIDLSASTNGILNDVRNRMWTVANGILKSNERTDLRIAIVGYGRPSYGSSDGFVKVLSGLTNDFDPVSYELFQIYSIIDKGDQFVPNALFKAFKDLKWSTYPGADKMVFLMGNGSVYTGSLNLIDLCEEYRKNNIRINTIFVSQKHKVMSQMAGYKGIADATGGKFYIMDASDRAVINKSPQVPPAILSLNDSLNKTFMFYTKDARLRNLVLTESDKNALKYGSRFFYSRMLYKTTAHYFEANEPYDLTAYVLMHNKMPERMNLDFIGVSENTKNLVELEKRARQKGADRMRLNTEIRNAFTDVNQGASQADTLFENFLLGGYR